MSKLNLVTGANGHLGNNLVRALLARGEAAQDIPDNGNQPLSRRPSAALRASQLRNRPE